MARNFPLHVVTATLLLVVFAACTSLPGPSASLPGPPAYDVFLLVGQSNMSGRGGGDLATMQPIADPRILAWDARQDGAARIVLARDPLVHQDDGQRAIAVGPGIAFAQATLARNRPGKKVLLVPAAFGGTGFSDAAHSWRVSAASVSGLVTEAVGRANAAMRELGATAQFAGILWHQGETDGRNGMSGPAYVKELDALAKYLREHIDGASATTPFLVGQYVPSYQLSSTLAANNTLGAIAERNQDLSRRMPYSACVSSAGLRGNPGADELHFDAASQRAMGRRYALALVKVQQQAVIPGVCVGAP